MTTSPSTGSATRASNELASSAAETAAGLPDRVSGTTLEVRGVSRWYGSHVAVNDISFAIGPGVTGLLGPNGAGKSTLLHMMSGFLKPSAGEVHVHGESAWRNPEMYRRVGLVPERESVYGFMTGFDFVHLAARLQQVPDPERAARQAIKAVEMEHAQERLTGGYSKGMKQRIKIAAAITHEPDILLLDEPFNGADPRQRLQMMDMLQGMAARGCTILFSSHILEEMERLGDRVLVIVAGRLSASGDFREIRRLMTNRPHTFTIRSSADRELARPLIAHPTVHGIEFENDALVVSTTDFSSLVTLVPRLARESGITIREMYPLDESLEKVFEYLVTQ